MLADEALHFEGLRLKLGEVCVREHGLLVDLSPPGQIALSNMWAGESVVILLLARAPGLPGRFGGTVFDAPPPIG